MQYSKIVSNIVKSEFKTFVLILQIYLSCVPHNQAFLINLPFRALNLIRTFFPVSDLAAFQYSLCPHRNGVVIWYAAL
jgi:hypothetical protein